MAEPKEEVIKTVVTDRGAGESPEDRSILRTPAGQANVEIVALSVWTQVGIRVLRTYAQSVLGFVLAVESGAAAGVGLAMPAQDFGKRLLVALSMAAAPAAVSLLQNFVELLNRLDQTNPTFRA